MHIVLLDLVLLDRSERAEPDVQRHIADADALGSDPLQKLRREVQTRRGSRRRAVDLGVDSLVALLVLQLLLDVGRQRHLAEPLEHLKENSLVVEAYQAVAVRQDLGDLRRQLAVAEAHPRTLAQVLARTHKALPHLIALVLQKQHLAGSAAGQTASQQSRRQNAGVIQDQAVPRPQKIRQLIKVVVRPLPRRLIETQQARLVALFQRRLRNQLRREVVVKIACFHLASFRISSA